MVFYSGDTSSNPAEVNLVFSVKILIEKYKLIEKEAVVVAQLILRSLPTPEIQMVERVIDKLYLPSTVLNLYFKDEKEARNGLLNKKNKKEAGVVIAND